MAVGAAVESALPPMFAAPINLAARVKDGAQAGIESVGSAYSGHTLPSMFEAPLGLVAKVNAAVSEVFVVIAGKLGVSALNVQLATIALAAVALWTLELRRRKSIIDVGDECMTTGDDGACSAYDEKVAKTPNWKLRLALNKLAQTNFLAQKMQDGAAPAGFEWGARPTHLS